PLFSKWKDLYFFIQELLLGQPHYKPLLASIAMEPFIYSLPIKPHNTLNRDFWQSLFNLFIQSVVRNMEILASFFLA
ncbi:hypothetical protein, partial [Enterococcus cecorum]|uniref:hypothetical protein n=1 Tax=Enterococcus cecorum TaxID=44008 RepID=UPI001AEC4C32